MSNPSLIKELSFAEEDGVESLDQYTDLLKLLLILSLSSSSSSLLLHHMKYYGATLRLIGSIRGQQQQCYY